MFWTSCIMIANTKCFHLPEIIAVILMTIGTIDYFQIENKRILKKSTLQANNSGVVIHH